MRGLPKNEAPDEKVAHDLVQCFTPLEFCKPFQNLQTQLNAMRNAMAPRKKGFLHKDTGRFIPKMPDVDENRRQIPTNSSY
jgi:hypothetical protein